MADWPYNTAHWQRLRRVHLDLFPLCEGCEAAGQVTPANTVDHRVAIKDGGLPFPTHDGLASYCPSCHSRKTVRGTEAGAVRTTRAVQPRKGCDAEGNPLDPSHDWHATKLRDGERNVQKSLGAARSRTVMGSNNQLVPEDRL